MKAAELRAMAREEIARKIDDLSHELFNLRFQLATRQLSDTSRVRQVKRDLTRAKTILHELEREVEVK